MIDSYYDVIAAADGGYLDSIKVTNLANAQGKGGAYSASTDEGELLMHFGDFLNVSVGDQLFDTQSLGNFGGAIEYNGDDELHFKEFFSEKVPLAAPIIFVPYREGASGKTYVKFDDMDSDDPYWVNIRTFGGDDVIEGIGGNTSFIDGGDGNDLLVVNPDNGGDGNIRAFGDFILINGLNDGRSHVLLDV